MELVGNELCTLLVNSCDAYEDLWYPFFTILKKQWPELSTYRIVLNTESKTYSYDGLNIKCYNLYKYGEKVKWGRRLIETLNRVETKYVIFLLDDFFVTETVNQALIDECVKYMEKDHHIATFRLNSISSTSGKASAKYKGFEIRDKQKKWALNTQAAIWRRDKLLNYVRPHESAWDWEIYGSERAKGYSEVFYDLIDKNKCVFCYENVWGGAIHRGKWTPYAIDLCKKYNIDIDYTLRGIETQSPPFDNDEFPNEMGGIKGLFRPPFFRRLFRFFHAYLIDYPKAKITRYKSLK